VDGAPAAASDGGSIDGMSERLLALAASHEGVFCTADATRLDVDPNALADLTAAGTVVRVRRGAYVRGDLWVPATPEHRLDLSTRAVLRARGRTGEAATHQSALAVHGLPLHTVAVDVVDLSGAVRRVRKAGSLRIHPADTSLDVVEVGGCRAVAVEVAIAQVALRHGREAAVVPTDRALRSGAVDLERVVALVARLAESSRAVVRAERWLREADAASESVGETRTRLLLNDLGHHVRSQVPIADDGGVAFARVDFLVGDRVIVEFDGLVKYAGAEGREALAAEKHREDRLRSLGYEVVRLTWSDLARPTRVEALIRSALQRAEARARHHSA
jgi:very-short-patch-repair endonuclease